jgi:ABC-type bacteriocin/lantibiotic exporter with double-glycine peptidase domain
MNFLFLILCAVFLIADEKPEIHSFDYRQHWQQNLLCGPNALFLYGRLSGFDIDYDSVREKIEIDPKRGCSVADLDKAAQELGLDLRVRKVTPTFLRSTSALPMVVHTNRSNDRWNTGHFLVLVGVNEEKKTYRIIDPISEANYSIEFGQLDRAMSGYALVSPIEFELFENLILFILGLTTIGTFLAIYKKIRAPTEKHET